VNAATGDAGAFVPVSDIVGRDGRRYAGYQTNANYGNALAIKFIEKCLSGNRMAEDVQSGTVATGSYSYTGGYRDDDSRAWGDLHATNVINVLAKNNDGKLAIGDCEYMGGVGMQIGAYGWCEPCTYSTVARQRVTATLDNNYNITGQDFSPTASYLTERLDEYLKASVMPILDVRDNYNAQRVSTPQTNFAGSLVYEAETDSYRIYSQVFETRPELNGKYRVPIAELVGDRGVVTLVIANVEDFTDEPSGFWAADGTVCEDEENCAPIGDRVNIAKSVSDMMNYWRGNGWRYYNIEKDKIDVLGGREITKREYYLLKANAAKQLCPTCLIAVAARNRDYYEDLLEADSALRWNEENPYGKLFQITRTQLNEQWNVDAQADVVDLIVDDWNIDALEAKDPGTEVDLQVNYSGSLIKRYHKPIFNWGLEIITAYVAADGSRDSNQTDYINVVNEIFGNQRDLTSAGTMGVAYPMWRGGWAALAKQDNVEGKRGDGSWQLLDGGGHYYAGDFCAVYSGSKKILGLKETTLYQKIYASETCECVLCSDDEIYDGMCGNLGLGVASSDGVEMECRMPDGEDPAQYKAPLSCITNSCMKCSASAGTASCSRISEGQAQKMGNVDISELGDIDKDIISALAPERKCCINDSEGNYTYLKYTGEIQKNEQVLYHRSGSIAFDCGKTPDLDPSVCGISINTEPSQVVCTYLE